MVQAVAIAEASSLRAVSMEIDVALDATLFGHHLEEAGVGKMASLTERQKGIAGLWIPMETGGH